MTGFIIAAVVVGAIGIALGIFLTYSSKKFEVPVDEKEAEVREALPGSNCGACGFPGCDGAAAAIVKGEAPVTACPVGGASLAETIAGIVGGEVGEVEKTTAYVKCMGDCEKAKSNYAYTGIKTCAAAAVTPGGGSKACSFGCDGFGDCVAVCDFDAIHIVNGIAVVDPEKCTSCGLCVKACPNALIEIIPAKARTKVACASKDFGKDVKSVCSTGCIGCKICEKQCPLPETAIVVTDNVAKIDYDRCVNCGKCAAKCPTKVIQFEPRKPKVAPKAAPKVEKSVEEQSATE